MEKAINEYNPQEIESKWRKYWAKYKTFQPDLENAKKPYYNLMMFPYPSAEGLHVGNMYAFTGSDIWGRHMKMKGHDVFEPIGLDGFGIHSENYAIKVGRHPAEQAKISQENFYRQLSQTGNMFSWDNRLETYDPDYYKWTQWIFTKMFKAGLAYRKKSSVNWCLSCKTVLADEQVIEEKCERCGTEVIEKELEQWFFKITAYAERLLNNLKDLDWSNKVKIAQKNWIGKSEGINITYKVIDEEDRPVKSPAFDVKAGLLHLTCFTTRPDTNFGATFVVISPEHPLVASLLKLKTQNSELKAQIEEYIKISQKKSKEDRIAEGREKTGVFTGYYCINNLTNRKMPLWISDFVLMDVGTGVVVGVPGHDLRDFEFAKTFGLPIIRVVVGKDGDKSEITKPEQVQESEGTMINSEFLNGLEIHKATQVIMDYLEKKGWGKKTVHYHLRDWLISRQRYWGPPIPMINCPKCGWVAVPEKDLPVKLPYLKDYRPRGTGRGPLALLKDWVKVKCPECGGEAGRETDVSDTFLDSAWYFLKYPSVKKQNTKYQIPNTDSPWDFKTTKKWLPVNIYIGGAEHSVLHLLYSRFVTMFFKDQGLLDFEEPFTTFRAHGLIIKDGAKMSKSKGNIVNPDEYIAKYGADTLRCYLMFLGPLSAGGDFRDTGMVGMHKFLSKVWRLFQDNIKNQKQKTKNDPPAGGINHKSEIMWQHKTIKRVSEGIERLKYNTSLAAIMEFVNFLNQKQKTKNLIPNTKYKIQNTKNQQETSPESLKTLVVLLAPFAPHLTEELWQLCKDPVFTFKTGSLSRSVHLESWPEYNPELIKEEMIEIVVQVNGRVRDRLKVAVNQAAEEQEIEKLARQSAKIKLYLKAKVKRVIFVSAKLINFVV